MLAARRLHADKLVLAVPPKLGQLRPVAVLPQLHGGHPPGIVILKQMLTRLSQPVAFLVQPFVVNLVATVFKQVRVPSYFFSVFFHSISAD
ncbi:hypothetical protein [Xenorhabdus szentirmaii]|uniref:hypothetical protein n=1 Tax=Xenorhabdus szentirmaii TaxID=290112 RepID=UPI002B414243|nr:hypothetical protein [Xenorhabdus sp. ZM]